MKRLAVIGTGPAGMTAALALARGGHDVTLVGPAVRPGDRRTTALMMPSIRVLESLGVWEDLRPDCAPLRKMRIIDGTKRLLRAPTVTFHATEIDEEAFGWNIPNDRLNAALDGALRQTACKRLEAVVTAVDAGPADNARADELRITLESGATFAFDGIIGADGKDSPTRKAARIATRETRLPQSALVCVFDHTRPHGDTSNEIHTESGPCTTVPMPGGHRSSLVWVLPPDEAEAKAALPAGDLSRAVEERMQSMLGAVTVDPLAGVQVWPLSGVLASSAASGRIALIGEAAHRFPPIGAQGLNLSIRDVAALADVLARNDGIATAFSFFARERAGDIRMRYAAVMTLNRSLLSGLLPAQLARGIGLGLLDALPGLRGLVMREGMEPGAGWRALRPARGSQGDHA